MKKIRRKDKIRVEKVGENKFNVCDRDDNVLIDSKEIFSLYFGMVTFEEQGKMRGSYLGDNPLAIIDKHSKKVDFEDGRGWVNEDNTVLKTAKLVAVQNGSGAVVIIQK